MSSKKKGVKNNNNSLPASLSGITPVAIQPLKKLPSTADEPSLIKIIPAKPTKNPTVAQILARPPALGVVGIIPAGAVLEPIVVTPPPEPAKALDDITEDDIPDDKRADIEIAQEFLKDKPSLAQAIIFVDLKNAMLREREAKDQLILELDVLREELAGLESNKKTLLDSLPPSRGSSPSSVAITQLSTQISDLEADIEAKENALADSDARVQQLITKEKQLRADFESKINMLTYDIETKEKSLNQLGGDINKLKKRIGDLEGEVQSKQGIIDSLRAKLTAPSSTDQQELVLKSYQDDIAELKTKLATAEEQLSNTVDEADDLKKEKSKLEVDLNQAKSQQENLQYEIDRLQAEVDDKKKDIVDLQAKVSDLKAKVKSGKQGIKDASSVVQALVGILADTDLPPSIRIDTTTPTPKQVTDSLEELVSILKDSKLTSGRLELIENTLNIKHDQALKDQLRDIQNQLDRAIELENDNLTLKNIGDELTKKLKIAEQKASKLQHALDKQRDDGFYPPEDHQEYDKDLNKQLSELRDANHSKEELLEELRIALSNVVSPDKKHLVDTEEEAIHLLMVSLTNKSIVDNLNDILNHVDKPTATSETKEEDDETKPDVKEEEADDDADQSEENATPKSPVFSTDSSFVMPPLLNAYQALADGERDTGKPGDPKANKSVKWDGLSKKTQNLLKSAATRFYKAADQAGLKQLRASDKKSLLERISAEDKMAKQKDVAHPDIETTRWALLAARLAATFIQYVDDKLAGKDVEYQNIYNKLGGMDANAIKQLIDIPNNDAELGTFGNLQDAKSKQQRQPVEVQIQDVVVEDVAEKFAQKLSELVRAISTNKPDTIVDPLFRQLIEASNSMEYQVWSDDIVEIIKNDMNVVLSRPLSMQQAAKYSSKFNEMLRNIQGESKEDE